MTLLKHIDLSSSCFRKRGKMSTLAYSIQCISHADGPCFVTAAFFADYRAEARKWRFTKTLRNTSIFSLSIVLLPEESFRIQSFWGSTHVLLSSPGEPTQ